MWIHGQNLLDGGSAQNPNDFHKLIDIVGGNEHRLTDKHLDEDTACRPHVDLGGVVGCSENQLRSSIASRTDVGDIGLTLHKLLSRTKIAHDQLVGFAVYQNIVWFYVSMADAYFIEV